MKASQVQVDSGHEAHVYEAKTDDLRSVADYARGRQDAGIHGDKDFKLAATVPVFIIHEFLNHKGLTWKEFMRDEKLQTWFLDSDYAKPFRVWKGRI